MNEKIKMRTGNEDERRKNRIQDRMINVRGTKRERKVCMKRIKKGKNEGG